MCLMGSIDSTDTQDGESARVVARPRDRGFARGGSDFRLPGAASSRAGPHSSASRHTSGPARARCGATLALSIDFVNNPGRVQPAAAVGEESKLLKAAIIGAGYIAHEHLDALRSLPKVRIAGVCDLSPAIAEATAEEFGAESHWSDHRAMLAEVQPDVIHVTTPPKSHVPLALDAIEAGAHVLIEKPIATNAADLEKLMSAASERGRVLVEDYNYLFNPSVQQILALIESGEFGDVVHVDVHFCVPILGVGSKHADPNADGPFAGLPGGAVADFITHLAYLSHAFVGAHRATHSSWRNRSGDPGVPYDEFRALVDAERGTACLGFSAHAQPDVFSLRVFGTKMRASASLFEPLLSIEKLRGGPRPLLPVMNGLAVARSYTRSALSGLYGKLQGKPGTYQGLWVLLEKLYGSIAAGEPPPITPERIKAVNELVDALLRDAEPQ